jgi:hypothetical protein
MSPIRHWFGGLAGGGTLTVYVQKHLFMKKQNIHTRKVIQSTAVFIVLGTSFLYSRGLDFDYNWLEKELSCPVVNHVEFKQVSDTPVVYRAWGAWNFGHSCTSVARVALDFKQFPKVIHYVFSCDSLTEPKNRLSRLGTWHVEGRAAIARVWALGNIDTITWTDSPLYCQAE